MANRPLSPHSSTSSVERKIQGLIRGDETDAEIDRIIADLLAQEAREAIANGPSAASSSRTSGFRPERRQPNSRFLTGILRSAETHNRSLLEGEGEKNDRERPRKTESDRPPDRSEYRRESYRRGHSDRHEKARDRGTPKTGRDDNQSSRKHSTDPNSSDKYRRSRSPDRSSKMDKYFDRSYDPALDVRSELELDRQGLVVDDGWDRVAEIARDKERRRRERRDGDRHGVRHVARRSSKDESNLLYKQYAKPGEQRSWDKGKK